MKRIISILLTLLLMAACTIPAYAVGEGNIDGGGSGMGGGSVMNHWNPGMDGVRVTVVHADTHMIASRTVDLTNKYPSAGVIHFGKVCKLSYNSGKSLNPSVGNYSCINPLERLPVIITSGVAGASIEAIKSYFTDEQVLKAICGYVGFNYDLLIDREYRLVIEPIVYLCYGGLNYAMTATEAALYDQQVSGNLRAYFVSLTHRNLPLAIFLRTSDLGYPAWTGSRTEKVSNSVIISSLGIGIVRFTELPVETEDAVYDYEYRVNTDVITSVEVSGGQSDPDKPVSVTFIIDGASYTVGNVYYPEGDSQLAWVRWRTPSEAKTLTIQVSVIGGGWVQSTIKCNIVDPSGYDPPNPVATDRNDSFEMSAAPQNAEVTSVSWGIWSPWWYENWVWIENWVQCWHSAWVSDGEGGGYWDVWYHWVDNGQWEDRGWWKFDYNSYTASLSAEMNVTPDAQSPTATEVTLKSGYGVNESVLSQVHSDQLPAVTAAQTAVTYFPEFQYKGYWRLLDNVLSGRFSEFEFKMNKYSTYNNRTHFTPIWYPDGAYTLYTYVMDCWTPTGMLSINLTDSVTIQSNLWDDWHIAPANP